MGRTIGSFSVEALPEAFLLFARRMGVFGKWPEKEEPFGVGLGVARQAGEFGEPGAEEHHGKISLSNSVKSRDEGGQFLFGKAMHVVHRQEPAFSRRAEALSRLFQEFGEYEFGNGPFGLHVVRHFGRTSAFVFECPQDPLPFPKESSDEILFPRVDAGDEKAERFSFPGEIFQEGPSGIRTGAEQKHRTKGTAGKSPAKREVRFLADGVPIGRGRGGRSRVLFRHDQGRSIPWSGRNAGFLLGKERESIP